MSEELGGFLGEVIAVFHSGSSTLIDVEYKKETLRFYLDKPEEQKIERGKTIVLNYHPQSMKVENYLIH